MKGLDPIRFPLVRVVQDNSLTAAALYLSSIASVAFSGKPSSFPVFCEVSPKVECSGIECNH